jgi:hypothetical protein
MRPKFGSNLGDLQEAGVSAIGAVYPIHTIVSQAEVRLIADETDKANTEKIKSDQQRVLAAREVEAQEPRVLALTC